MILEEPMQDRGEPSIKHSNNVNNNNVHINHNDTQPSAFLTLPRELRDLIYTTLIHSTRPPPKGPDEAGERIPHSNILFEARSPKPVLLQLKLCSRQTYAEVQDVLFRHECERRDDRVPAPHLDIMIRGSCIWPTWIALPVTLELGEVVNVTLRLFEGGGSPAIGSGGFSSNGNGSFSRSSSAALRTSEFSTGAYRGLWSLFNLLVSRGPCLIHNTRSVAVSTTNNASMSSSNPSTLLLPPRPLHITRLRFTIILCTPNGHGSDSDGMDADDVLFGTGTHTQRAVFERLEKLAFDNVGLGHVETIEACMGAAEQQRRVWRLKQLPTGLTLASRVE